MMRPLLSLRQGLDGGVFKSLDPTIPDYYWEDCRNVLFRDGGVTVSDIFSGRGSFTITQEPRLGLWQSRTYAFTAKADGIYRTELNGDSVTVSTAQVDSVVNRSYSANGSDLFQWVNWDAAVCAVNGTGNVRIMGTGTLSFRTVSLLGTAIGTPGLKASLAFKLGPHLVVAGSFSTSGSGLRWGDTNAPESFTISAASAAGSLPIREANGKLTACAPLADRQMVYTRTQAFFTQYLGPPYVFGYQLAMNDVGVVGKNAVVSIAGYNYGLSDRGFFRTNGMTAEPIDTPQIRTWFQDRVNRDYIEMVNAVHAQDQNMVIWAYPCAPAKVNNEAVGFDYIKGTWTIFDFGWSAASNSEALNYPLLGYGVTQYNGTTTVAGEMQLRKRPVTDAYSPPFASAYAETKDMDMGDKNTRKLILGAKIGIYDNPAGYQDTTFQIGTREKLTDSVNWSSTLTVSAQQGFLPLNAQGRWVRLRFGATNFSGQRWSVQTIDLYGQRFGRDP